MVPIHKARHHLRFYDARVITVKQPSLSDIVKSLNDAFELSRITHQDSPSLEKLTLAVGAFIFYCFHF